MARNKTRQKTKHKNKNKLRIRRTKVLGPKGIDQIKEQVESHREVEYDPDLPGCGQSYCYECDRHFVSDDVLVQHRRSRQHKRRVKEAKDVAHSQKDAEWAVGLT